MKTFFSIFLALISFYTFGQEPALPNLNNYTKVRDFTISNNLKEAYFTVQSPNEELSGIFKSVKLNGSWSEAQLVSFSGEYKDLEPYLSPNGLRLYFASNRPLTNKGEAKDFDIWYIERNSLKDKWSEPKNLGTPINTKYNEFYPAIASSKNLYFTSDRPSAKGKDNIFLSEYRNGEYQASQSLSTTINTEGYEFNSYIAPDESFILFSGYNRKDGLGSGDMYISYFKSGKWLPAINLGASINSKQMDYCPFVHIPSKTLYFTSRRSDIIADKSYSTKGFISEINKYTNGLSRIYKMDFSKFID